MPENPQKSNEDERFGTTSCFLYCPQELKSKVVQGKCKGTVMLMRARCIWKAQP